VRKYSWAVAPVVVVSLMFLVGCGGGSSSSSNTSGATPFAIPLPDKPHGMFVWQPPNETDDPSGYNNHVLPNLITGPGAGFTKGAVFQVPWNVIEPTEGTFDFTEPDLWCSEWTSHGKQCSLAFESTWFTTDKNFTPDWYSSANPMYGSPCTGQQSSIPVFWGANFQSAWQGVIKAAVDHYGTNASVAYLRFGFGVGDENHPNLGINNPDCFNLMTSLGYSNSVWSNYLKTMSDYVHSLNSSKQIDFALNFPNNAQPDTNIVSQIASTAAADGFTLDNHGFTTQDVNSGVACSADFCALYPTFKGKVPLALQFANTTDPNGGGTVGSATVLLPFALSLGVQSLEIYSNDWLCTYDSKWVGPGNNNFSSCQTAGYPATFSNGASSLN
jgi:hypothetical protein